MRHLLVMCPLGMMLALFALSNRAVAQGCNLAIQDVDVQEKCNGEDIVEQYCEGPGTQGYYCSIGHGECPYTGYQFTTANISPDPSCNCQPPGGGCGSGTWNPALCECQSNGQSSPIIIDTVGTGFSLTSADNGVVFDIRGDGRPIRLAWTASASGNAFLALDRNHDGKIDSGKELFGNFTEQPKSQDPNGFLALAEFDRPEKGGNGDGIIDDRDAVFSHLLLWIDENHDGISQPDELHSLPELGVFSLALRHAESRRTDQFGNQFRYRAAVNPDPQDGESKDGRVTYDVFFVSVEGQSDVGDAVDQSRSRLSKGRINGILRRLEEATAMASFTMT